jgi:CTP synthase
VYIHIYIYLYIHIYIYIHSVKELRSAGFSPDFIVCRAKKVIDKGSRNKISLFCNVEPENVLSIPDVSNIYHVPLLLLEQNFHNLISKKLNLNILQQEKLLSMGDLDMNKETVINDELVKSWDNMVKRIDEADDEVSIVLIGKYLIYIYISIYIFIYICIYICIYIYTFMDRRS